MSTEQALIRRSQTRCELCQSNQQLSVYRLPPDNTNNVDNCILVCATCHEQLHPSAALDNHHWHCLNNSMWSQIPAVQVVAWRQLKRLSQQPWAQDLLDMLYLEEEIVNWAKAAITTDEDTQPPTLDSNGSVLTAGDAVTVIKNLVVKGAGFTAKRGTVVRNIALTDNPEQIEGRVNGTRIVLLSKFLKKTS